VVKKQLNKEMKRISAFACLLFCAQSVYGQKATYETRTKLSDSVNVKEDESAVLLSPDGKTLYFVRSFYSENIGGATGKQDIYFSNRKSETEWSVAKNIGAPLNDEFHNAVCGVSRDGNKLYLNAIKVRQDKSIPGISICNREENGWSKPVALTTYEFPEKGFFQAYVSPDEDYIIASFEGKNGMGLEDLYVLKKDATGKFSAPINMGKTINSSGFETSPIVSADGKTLYFSSNGFGGQGDGDIFKSTRQDDSWTSWSTLENLGPRINTVGFDGSFSIDEKGNAYYISGEGATGNGDIYTISMIAPPPPPPVVPAPAQVVSAPPVVETPKPVEVPKSVEAPKPNSVETFGPALFEFNSIVINPDSKESLKMVAERLKKNSSYRIQIEGHTDEKGPEVYNQELSEKRANSVKKYLVKNGIKASNIKTQGFGKLNPITDNSTEEGRSKNRRVEVKYFLP